MRGKLLFAVDLEDVRDFIPGGEKYAPRVEVNTIRFLDFLDSHKSKATFFTVGIVAEKHPDIIKEIIHRGHEIGCHTNKHVQLNKQTPESFKVDLLKNIEKLEKVGATKIKGFRAPTFSLDSKTQWAYEVLEDLGFAYSSSVLPAPNPLYGWPGFGEDPELMNGKVWELPISTMELPFMKVPMVGGIYFRALPFFIIRNNFLSSINNGKNVLSYFHPYDIDEKQEKFMHPDINQNKFYNWLMYYNRKKTFSRLEKLLKESKCEISDYITFVNTLIK
jgi:polysaccharide deacetylase family protein (PEP-CTERM system associated)